MKRLILSFLFATVTKFVIGQNVEWYKQLMPLEPQVDAGFVDFAVNSEGEIFVIGNSSGATGFLGESDEYSAQIDLDDQAIFISKLSSSGQILWVKKIISTVGILFGEGVKIKSNGDIIVTGVFNGEVDFDPGEGSFFLNSNNQSGYHGIFILSLNSVGEFQWGSQIEILTLTHYIDFDIDSQDNILVLGGFAQDYSLAAGDYSNHFLFKFSNSGNTVWSKFWGCFNCHARFNALAINSQDHIVIAGHFGGTFDFDPGNTEALITSSLSDQMDGFYLELDENGEFEWFNKLNTLNGSSIIRSLSIDNSGNIIMYGYFTEEIEVFVNGITETLNSGDDLGHFVILKSDNEGNLIWARQIVNNSVYGYQYINEGFFDFITKTDHEGNIYIGQIFNGEFTFGFTPGVVNLATTMLGQWNFIIYKFSASGSYQWAINMGSHGNSLSFHIKENGNILFAADSYYYGEDEIFGQIPSPNWGNSFGLIAEVSGASCLYQLAHDQELETLDCQSQTGTIHVFPTGGTPPFNYEWNDSNLPNDSIVTVSQPGIYSVDVTDSEGCHKELGVYVDGPSSFESFDLQTFTTANEPLVFVPGLTSTLDVHFANIGCFEPDAQLQFVISEGVSYVSSSISPTSIFGDTLLFDFVGLSYPSYDIISITVATDTSAQLGDEVCFSSFILPNENDSDVDNNSYTICRNVQTSYDPNLKSVYPVGECEQHYVELDQKLTYTVQFQNTGTFAAINIAVMDTLSSLLDINTLRVIHSSHDMITEVYDDHILKFKFPNIYLADSATNEEESHGYIIFEIEPKTTIASGSMIENNVAIYFDYNAPVITNKVFNTFVHTIPECVVSLDEIVSKDGGLLLYPNPVGDMMTLVLKDKSIKGTTIRISDITGKVIEHKNHNVDGNIVLDTSALESGVYVLTLMNGQEIQSVRFVKQ